MNALISRLRNTDFPDTLMGAVVGFLIAGAIFTVIQERVNDMMNDRAIDNAQLQVADALTEAHRFRASLECTAATPDGCKCWGLRP